MAKGPGTLRQRAPRERTDGRAVMPGDRGVLAFPLPVLMDGSEEEATRRAGPREREEASLGRRKDLVRSRPWGRGWERPRGTAEGLIWDEDGCIQRTGAELKIADEPKDRKPI